MTELLIDANSLFARTWYATTRDRIDANHVLRSALQTTFSLINPDVDRIGDRVDRVLFCWDGDNHGHDKGERLEKPREYHACREIFKEIITATIGAAHCQPDRYEADDTVATAVHRSKARLIYVVSGDKDLLQLVSNKVRYFCLNKKMILPQSTILSRFSVKQPRQVAIALAILGDKIDNIKGIKGWGPAKVKLLFKQVPDGADLDIALELIDAQIPHALKPDFFESLDRTLLDPSVPGVCDPAPVTLCSVEEALDMGIDGIEDAFYRMYTNYTGQAVRPAPARVGFEEYA